MIIHNTIDQTIAVARSHFAEGNYVSHRAILEAAIQCNAPCRTDGKYRAALAEDLAKLAKMGVQ